MQDAEPERLLERLAETPRALAAYFAAADAVTLRRRSGGDPFAPIEHLCHVRDIEREGYAIRIQRILEESNPFLPDLDGDRLARERDYIDQDGATALAAFAHARGRVIELLGGISAGDWERTATMGGFGILTLRSLVLRMLAHDGEHLAALERSPPQPFT
jgi:hypothetical protein